MPLPPAWPIPPIAIAGFMKPELVGADDGLKAVGPKPEDGCVVIIGADTLIAGTLDEIALETPIDEVIGVALALPTLAIGIDTPNHSHRD